MKFKSTLTKIAEEMISPSTTSKAPAATTPTSPPTSLPTASPTAPGPVQNNTSITKLEALIKSLPDTHPKKPVFLNQLKVLQQAVPTTDQIEKILSAFQISESQSFRNPSNALPENTLTPFYAMLGRAYKTLNEAAPKDLNAAQTADAALPQPVDPNAAQPADTLQSPPAPAPSPDELDKLGETEKLENDSNKIVLVGILNRVLSELLKHQNEVITNSSSEESEKKSADYRAKALTRLINTTTSENLATSKLNNLIKHIKTEFYLIYPTGNNKLADDNSKLSNKGELINIIIGILNELLKHQNEVITNIAVDMPNKISAGRWSESLKRLIDHIGADKSELNILLQYIQSQFNQIYPIT